MKTHPDQLTAEEWIILRLMRRMVGTPAVVSSEFANTCFFIYKIMAPSCFTSACRELQNDEVFRPDTEGLLTMNEVMLKGKERKGEAA